MKFILFDINDTSKNTITKIQLDNNRYIQEVSFSKEKLVELDKNDKSFFAKVKRNIYDRDMQKKIIKALEHHGEKWYYIPSNKLLFNKHIFNKAESLLGHKLVTISELDTNIFKYVEEQLKNNNRLKKHELKVLLVVKENKSLNFTLLNNLIKEYKSVNIYLNENPTSYTLKKIKQINKEEGTTIDIIKKERKVFGEYNVVYFVDDVKANYPRFRLDKRTLVLDMETARKDIFNTNLTFLDEYAKQNEVFKDNIQMLLEKYDNLELATIIREIVN